MPTGPGLYSRLVTVLKVLLPLVAVGMLASLFLIQTEDDPGAEIGFSEGDLEALGEGLRITNPTFGGTSEAGDSYRFTAEVVVPDAAPPTRAEIERLAGSIDFADGPEVAVRAEKGELDIAARLVTLTGDVRIESSDGAVLHAPEVTIDLAAGTLEGSGEVISEASMGQITSGSLRIAPAEGDDGMRRFSFGNRVGVVYDPASASN